jgi:hypothetical protein
MKQGMGTSTLRIGVGAIACGLAIAGFSTASASAAQGDTFFLLDTKATFVSFVVRAGSDEATRTLYSARRIPCRGKPKRPPTAMGYLSQRPVPIVDGAFYVAWSALDASAGGLNGTVNGDTASGTLNLRMQFRKPHGKNKPPYTCSTGGRKWTAESVSEKRWNTVREKRYGSSADPPVTPPAGA